MLNICIFELLDMRNVQQGNYFKQTEKIHQMYPACTTHANALQGTTA